VSLTLDPVVPLAIRGGLVLLLGGALVHKLRSLRAFRAAVRGFGIVPDAFLGAAALAVPIVEGVTLALLVARPTIGGPAAAALLGGYAVAMALALARGRGGADCGCGGPAGTQPLRGGLIARNVVLALPALLLAMPANPRPLAWLDGVTLVGSVAAMTILLVAGNTVLATAPRIRELQRGVEATS